MQIHQLHQLKAMLQLEEEPILLQDLLQQQIEHHILLQDLLHQHQPLLVHPEGAGLQVEGEILVSVHQDLPQLLHKVWQGPKGRGIQAPN